MLHWAPVSAMAGLWSQYRGGRDADTPEVDTTITLDMARTLLNGIGTVPEGFNLHPKLVKFMEARREMAEGSRPLDWGSAEALAFGSLVNQGNPVRVSGQDARRGTFAHRHALLRDYESGREYVPLLAYGPQVRQNVNLGTRATLSDIGQTVAENFGVQLAKGTSFLSAL